MANPKIGTSSSCPVCGGMLVEGAYDHVIGSEHIEHTSGEIKWIQHIIENVPAQICMSCGSPWVQDDDGVVEKLQTYVKSSAEQGVFVSTINYLHIAPAVH